MNWRQRVATRGEAAAADYLRANGFTILDRNFRLPQGELDLVAREGDEIVFVEVKTRSGSEHLAPDQAVTAVKLDRLGRLAEAYLIRHGHPDASWRVDVIAVILDSSDRVRQLEHIRGAFL
jgi:putative endonuclease